MNDSIERRVAEQASVRLRRYLSSSENLQLSVWEDREVDKLVMELEAFFQGIEDEHIRVDESWPLTWWDAVKERFAPAWFRRRWPVHYGSVHVDRKIYQAVCPHLPTDPKHTHYEWFTNQSRREWGDVEEAIDKLLEEVTAGNMTHIVYDPEAIDELRSAFYKLANVITDIYEDESDV